MFDQVNEIAPVNEFFEFMDYNRGGILPKGWYKINGKIELVKGCSATGTEAISEVLASNLAQSLNLKHIPYRLNPARLFKSLAVQNDSCPFFSTCPLYSVDGLTKVNLLMLVAAPYFSEGIHDVVIREKECLEYVLTMDQYIKNKIFDIILFDAIICTVDRARFSG